MVVLSRKTVNGFELDHVTCSTRESYQPCHVTFNNAELGDSTKKHKGNGQGDEIEIDDDDIEIL